MTGSTKRDHGDLADGGPSVSSANLPHWARREHINTRFRRLLIQALGKNMSLCEQRVSNGGKACEPVSSVDEATQIKQAWVRSEEYCNHVHQGLAGLEGTLVHMCVFYCTVLCLIFMLSMIVFACK